MKPLKFLEDWVEVVSVSLLIIGFLISVLLQNAILSYIAIFLTGLLSGRAYYIIRYKEPIFPFILMITGFLLGYIIGGFYVNRIIIFVLFLFSFSLSYYLHNQKIIAIFKSDNFLK